MIEAGFGCMMGLVIFVGCLAVQALFLNLGAKMAGVESHYSKAVKAVLLYLLFAVPAIIGSMAYLMHKAAGQIPNPWTELLVITISVVIAGTIAVCLVYKISIVRGFLTYVASLVVSTLASTVFYGIILGIFWMAMGTEEFNEELQASKRAFVSAWRQGAGYSGGELLSPVEETEMENAFDIELARADHYIGKTVRVIHGPRSATIGTLVRNTPDQLIVLVKLEGGRVEIPISKSKITTFQMVDE